MDLTSAGYEDAVIPGDTQHTEVSLRRRSVTRQRLAQTVTAYPGHLREPLLRDVDRPGPGRCGQRLEQIVTPLKALGPEHTGA